MVLLPDQILGKQRRMEELQQALSEPSPSEGELHERGRQLEQVRAAVQQLEQQKRAKSNNPDDKLGMFRQQANLVAKKKEQVQQRLALVRRDNATVAADLQGKAVLKGEEFRKYASELRGKTAQYKRMKQE